MHNLHKLRSQQKWIEKLSARNEYPTKSPWKCSRQIYDQAFWSIWRLMLRFLPRWGEYQMTSTTWFYIMWAQLGGDCNSLHVVQCCSSIVKQMVCKAELPAFHTYSAFPEEEAHWDSEKKCFHSGTIEKSMPLLANKSIVQTMKNPARRNIKKIKNHAKGMKQTSKYI